MVLKLLFRERENMDYKNIQPFKSIYIVDVDNEEYIITDSDKYEFILFSFQTLRSVNSSIPVIDNKGNLIFIKAKKVKKICVFTNSFIHMQIF